MSNATMAPEIMQFGTQATAASQLKQMISAAAAPMREFTVRQDYMSEVGDYLYRFAPFWTRLVKVAAEADLIREIRTTSLPVVGFSDKQDLTTGPSQPTGAARNRNDFSDPGQYVKALSGFIDWSHYARSLADQQGKPYGDQVAIDTDAMLESAARALESTFWTGNAVTNPLEFNGVARLMPTTNHVYTLDLTDPANTITLSQKLVEVATRIMSSRTILRSTTNIVTSGSGLNLVTRENEARRLITEPVEVIPGVTVPGIRTPDGVVPIEATRYIDDLPGGGAGGRDVISFWFINMDKLRWKGVVPQGGENTFEPQVFTVTNYQNTRPLTESQMVLIYGTLYANNRGEDLYRLDVTVPAGTGWQYTI